MKILPAILALLASTVSAEQMGPPAPAKAWALEAPEASQPWGWQEGLIIGASVADLASTEYALRTPGAREGNPLLVSRSVRLPLKLAYTGVVVWLYRTLERRGQHGWAKTVLVWSVALWAGAAGWNMSQGR